MSTEHEESTEHFFASFTDLMVGVIFLFMLVTMGFGLAIKDKVPERIVSEDIRTDIIRETANRMRALGFPVAVDYNNGIIRLPEALLFSSGDWHLSEQGTQAVEALAHVLHALLPCAATANEACEWFKQPVPLDSVLIEGHTDKRPFNGANGMGNWELSAFRSISVYKAMTAAVPALAQGITNTNRQPILGVSGYGESRLVSAQDDPNRRIDIRFVMRSPTAYNNSQP